MRDEDLPEFKRILANVQGRAPSERPPRRSSTRDDLLEEEASIEIQAGVPTHAAT